MEDTVYIGDGVYAHFDGYGISLLTGSHDNPENKVYLEPSVLQALNELAKKWYVQKTDCDCEVQGFTVTHHRNCKHY